jgi:hypothetical protein
LSWNASHFGVSHRGGRIAVDRTEIALAVDQRHADGEILRHARERVIDRLVAMGVIFADHVAHDAGGFAIGLVPVVAVFVHRIEDAAMHGLEAVTRIGKRPRDDHAHRIIEIRLAKLVLDGNRTDAAAACRRGAARGLVAQNAFLNRASSGRGRGPDFQPAS